MKKFKILLCLLVLVLLTGCTYYTTDITKIYSVEDFKVHEAGVEVWALSEDSLDAGFFISHDNVYSFEGESRVICIYKVYYTCKDVSSYTPTNTYLYLSEDDFKSLLEEKYNIEIVR